MTGVPSKPCMFAVACYVGLLTRINVDSHQQASAACDAVLLQALQLSEGRCDRGADALLQPLNPAGWRSPEGGGVAIWTRERRRGHTATVKMSSPMVTWLPGRVERLAPAGPAAAAWRWSSWASQLQ